MRRTTLILLLALMSFTAKAQLNKHYFYYIGQELILQERYRDAIDVLSVLLKSDTTASDGYFLRGVAKYNLDDLIGAEYDFTKAVKFNSVYTQAYQYRAISRAFMGNYDGALKDFGIAIDIRPDQASAYYSRGVTYFMSQQFDKAIVDFNYFIKKKPQVTDAYINRGTCYLMLKDTTKAYENYDMAVKVNYFSPDGYLRRGSIHLMRKEYAKAFEDFNKSIEIDSVSEVSYFNRALTYSATNRPVEAIKDLTTVIRLDTISSLSFFNRAILYSQIGDYHKAITDYTKVTQYSPQNVLAYYNRGAVNAQIGNLEAAERDFTKAIELFPDFANAYLNRSSVRYMLRDMRGSEKDKKIADQKIADYRSNLNDSTLSMYADTSKVFDRLLSFDVDFKNKDFENVRAKDVDIKLLAMYRIAGVSAQPQQQSAALKPTHPYEIQGLNEFMAASSLRNLEITTRPTSATAKELEAKYIDLQQGGNKGNRSINDFDKALIQYQMRQYTSSIKHYSDAIKEDSGNPFLYMNRSVANCEMIEFISSIDNKSQRIVIDADPVNQLKNTQKTYSYDKCFEDINRAINLMPDVAYFYYNRASLYCLSGNMPEAIKDYTKAIELYPFLAEAYYNRGLILIYLKDTKKGCMDISKSGELGIEQAYVVLKKYGNNTVRR